MSTVQRESPCAHVFQQELSSEKTTNTLKETTQQEMIRKSSLQWGEGRTRDHTRMSDIRKLGSSNRTASYAKSTNTNFTDFADRFENT